MTKAILFLFFVSIHIHDLKAQNGVPDTLVYLKTIVDNKNNFVGKPFGVLVDSLKIKIKYFSPFAAEHKAKDKETSTSFSFYYPRTADEIYLTYPHIEIFWQTPLDAIQSDFLYTKFRFVGWHPEIARFYSTAIIDDLQIIE